LKNNYTDTIFTIVTWAGMDHVYPDTTLPIKQPGMRYVPPGEKGVISDGNGRQLAQYLFKLTFRYFINLFI